MRAGVLAAAMVSLMALGGCGFEPLYGARSCGGAQALAHLSVVEVARIDDRIGQVLRNAVRDRLNPSGRSGLPLYRLEIIVEESRSQLVVRRDAASTFSKVQVVARYSLKDGETGEVLDQGRSSVAGAFNIVESGFANLSAERTARDRAAREVGRDIHTRLSVFFRKKAGCT